MSSWAPDGGDLVLVQLASVQAWLALHRNDQVQLVPAQNASREQHQDLRYRAAALRAEAAALREHCLHGEHLPRRPRAVLVHRNDWMIGKLAHGLTDRGVHVAATATDGAVGCGLAIAEAPDLLVLEAGLPTMTGEEVARRVRHCSPTTVVTSQVASDEQASALLEAGAVAAWLRRVPPADLVKDLCALLQRSTSRGAGRGPARSPQPDHADLTGGTAG